MTIGNWKKEIFGGVVVGKCYFCQIDGQYIQTVLIREPERIPKWHLKRARAVLELDREELMVNSA